MSNKHTSNRKPTHAAYHVRGEGESAFWTKIGAAWMHEDQGGLNVSLDLVPVTSTGRIVIRANRADEQSQGESK